MTHYKGLNRKAVLFGASLLALSSAAASAGAAPLFDSQGAVKADNRAHICLLYTSPSPRDA